MPAHTEPKAPRPQSTRLERLFYSTDTSDDHRDYPQLRRHHGRWTRRASSKLTRRSWREERHALMAECNS